MIPQEVEVSSSNSSNIHISLIKEPINAVNAIDPTSTQIPNSTNKTNETVCLDQTPIEYLKTNRFSPFFPSELRAVMQRECTNDLCFLLAREEANITQKIDELGTSRLAVLSQQWRDWNQAEHGVLNFSYAAINSIGDLSLCRMTTGIRVVGSWGCTESPPKPVNCRMQGPTYAKVIVISQRWGDNYFHAIVEGLPRLAAALDSLPPSENVREWQVHSMMHEKPLAAELAAFMGVGGIVGGDIFADHVLVPTPTPCGGHISGPIPARLRSRIHSRLPHMCWPAHNRLLVLFRRSGKRELANHDEVARAARRLWAGGTVEHGGEGTFRAQMELYAVAAAVLGPHGAGMTGMIAMRPGGAVAEVLPEAGNNRLNMCYATLAHVLGLRYYAVRAPGFDSSEKGTVDLAQLEALPLWTQKPPPGL